MIEYLCQRCGYKTPRKSNILSHFNRKRVCKPIIQDINIVDMMNIYGFNTKDHKIKNVEKTPKDSEKTPKDSEIFLKNSEKTPKDSEKTPKDSENKDTSRIIIKYKNKRQLMTTQCIYCNYIFTKRCNLIRHYNRCKKKKETDIKNENKELKLQIENLKNSSHVINVYKNDININSVTNNKDSNNIIIHNYGKEDLSYLTHSEMTNYVKNLPPGVIKFIERVHFNPKHPENTNLRITNKKESFIQIRKKNKWIMEDKMNVISNLLSHKYQLLEDHLADLSDEDLTTIDKRVIDRFRNNYDSNMGYVKGILKKIELMIMNNSNLFK